MAVQTFGVTFDGVRGHYFPQFDAWTTTSRPSSTVVTEAINAEAAYLQGRLLKEAISADTIALAPTSAAYLMCADQLRLRVAVRLCRSIPGVASPLADVWEKQAGAWFTSLESDGGTFLGDDSLSTSSSDPDGPTSYLEEFGIDVGDPADASSAEPRLRRDDQL